VRREAFRLAGDLGAGIVTRPANFSGKEPAVRDVEALAGARVARDLELAARSAARDYIGQAREAGHGWDQIGRALGLVPGGDADWAGATPADAANTYASGCPDTEAPWQPRYFVWTCRSCDKRISDRGLIQGPTDDRPDRRGRARRPLRPAQVSDRFYAEFDRTATVYVAEPRGLEAE